MVDAIALWCVCGAVEVASTSVREPTKGDWYGDAYGEGEYGDGTSFDASFIEEGSDLTLLAHLDPCFDFLEAVLGFGTPIVTIPSAQHL
eukprot:m.28253 g.28253  ORF g.28253 m.28253 type:complete len:89 (-) comp9030_c0_seq1:139-405(-)